MGYGRHATLLSQYSTPLVVSEIESDILNFLLWMKREGYSESTVDNVRKIIRKLARRIGTLLDGNAVKDYVSNMNVRGGTKKLNLLGYRLYAKWKGFQFEMPRVSDTEPQLPFVPTEQELSDLIAGSSRKLACLLLLLKEGGFRIGEVLRAEWTDLDPESCILNIRAEKGSRNRQTRLSSKLVAMLMRLPKKNKLLFSGTKSGTFRNHLDLTRRRLADKLGNQRLLKVHAHSFRHYVACRTYWQTKDLLFTQKVLGHRSLASNLRYTQLVDWKQEDSFHSKAVKTTRGG